MISNRGFGAISVSAYRPAKRKPILTKNPGYQIKPPQLRRGIIPNKRARILGGAPFPIHTSIIYGIPENRMMRGYGDDSDTLDQTDLESVPSGDSGTMTTDESGAVSSADDTGSSWFSSAIKTGSSWFSTGKSLYSQGKALVSPGASKVSASSKSGSSSISTMMPFIIGGGILLKLILSKRSR